MYGRILQNWSLSPIDDIKTISDTLCPDDYDPLIKYTFPGIKDGCNCLGITNTTLPNYENKIIPGQCSYQLRQLGCVEITGIDRFTVRSLNNSNICLKRLNGFNYVHNYSAVVNSVYCSKGKHDCGEIDTLGNRLCVNDGMSCPSVDLIQKINPQIKDLFIEFIISQGEVCINNSEINLKGKKYELYENRRFINCNTTLNGIKYDNRYIRINNFATSQLFNSSFLGYLNSLPEFPNIFTENPLTLYGRKYIGWSKTCENYLPLFLSFYNLTKRLEINPTIYLLVFLLLLLYCMFFIMILKELLYAHYNIKLILVILHKAFISILLAFIIADYNLIENSLTNFLILISNNCSDKETNLLMINIYDFMLAVRKLYLSTIVLLIVTVMICLFKLVVICLKMKKRSILRRFATGQVEYVELMLLV
jgi:hypothetical protein